MHSIILANRFERFVNKSKENEVFSNEIVQLKEKSEYLQTNTIKKRFFTNLES